MSLSIREMQLGDYPSARTLWKSSEGVGLSDADSRDRIEQFLTRNPGLSLVGVDGDTIVATILCGHDGRRGYIHHLAIAESHRRRGLGRDLVERCLAALAREKISKCHAFVFDHNQDALEFWKRSGWTDRVEIHMHSSATREV